MNVHKIKDFKVSYQTGKFHVASGINLNDNKLRKRIEYINLKIYDKTLNKQLFK